MKNIHRTQPITFLSDGFLAKKLEGYYGNGEKKLHRKFKGVMDNIFLYHTLNLL
ncbi:MAG: hypothetical protein Q8P29_01375 [Candidatus Levybacteria bacterium]|nr:hypothetical protein [Candidatus Levybacteria bacterium]MDZ4227641.1 hypothetical protein [Candidatus Levybacteria bacterium]